jgi:asparagine synthase (glutamine-hydrolysing)
LPSASLAYLSGGFDFIADRIAAGEYWRAVNDLTELAVTTRQSFWSQAWKHGLEPLAPSWLRRPRASGPAWLVGAGAPPPPELGTGSRFGDAVACETAATELLLNRGPFERGLEVRYPFLYRPLVEFGLGLPVDLRVRPGCQKWILRQAVGDLLPRRVAARTGKGGIDGRVLWSLNREKALLRRLIADSHLAELGVVDRTALSDAFERACRGDGSATSQLFFTLSLETWLAVHSGWWTRHAMANPAARIDRGASRSSQEQHHAEATVR